MTTIASIVAGLVLLGVTTVGVVHAVTDSGRGAELNPTSSVVPYGQNN